MPAAALAGLIAALMHSLSLRARAGVAEPELMRWAEVELALVLAAASPVGRDAAQGLVVILTGQSKIR